MRRLLFFLLILTTIASAQSAMPVATLGPESNVAFRHVIHISADGLSAVRLRDSLRQPDPERLPAFRRLIAEGAFTFNARTDQDYTITLPNHTCMITGRPVQRPGDETGVVHHGWTGNDTPTRRQTLHNQIGTDRTYIPSVLDVVHDHGLSTGVFASKEKFILYEQSYNENTGAPDVTGEDNGRDKIDVFAYNRSEDEPQNAAPLIEDLIDTMRTQHLNYAFVHVRDPDTAGHKDGWESREWRESVASVDRYLQRLFNLIESDDTLRSQTAIILTTDHGGREGNHGNEAEPLNFIIPFFVWGPGVAPGADLYVLNPRTRRSPPTVGRDARPRYTDRIQPIRNGDSGNLALQLLGLPAIPGSMINAGQELRVRR